MKSLSMGRSVMCVLLVSGVATVTGCASGSSGSDGLNLGAIIPLSGVSASIGEDEQKAIHLAADKYAALDTNPVKMKFHYADNPGSPAQGVTALNKLVSTYHIPFAITSKSSVTVAQVPIAERNDVLLLNPGATDPGFRGMSDHLLVSVPLGDSQYATMMDYAHKALNVRRLAVVYSNDEFGQTMKKLAPSIWKGMGGTYAGDSTVELTQTDFSNTVTKLKQLHPDAVYLAFFGTGPGNLMKQASDLGLKTTWLGSTNIDNPAALKIAGSGAEGMYSTQVETANNADAQNYLAQFQAKYHTTPSALISLEYAAAEEVGQALAGLAEKKEKVTGSTLVKEFHARTFDTIYGQIKYKSDGTVETPIAVTKYTANAFKTVKTYSPDAQESALNQ